MLHRTILIATSLLVLLPTAAADGRNICDLVQDCEPVERVMGLARNVACNTVTSGLSFCVETDRPLPDVPHLPPLPWISVSPEACIEGAVWSNDGLPDMDACHPVIRFAPPPPPCLVGTDWRVCPL